MLKHGLKELAAAPFRLLPPRARRRLVQVILHGAATQEPRRAMRDLLDADIDLGNLIDQVALRYDGGIHVKHRLMRYHDFFVDRIETTDRVLDIGCGYGAVAHSIASRSGAAVVGLDDDAANIEKAKRLFAGAGLTFVKGHAPEDVPNGPFSVIVMSNVLEHIEQRVGFLSSLQRRVGPQRWLLRVPMINRDWRVPLRQELGLYHFSDPTHFTEYTRESFEAEMVEAHLVIASLQVNWGEIWAEVHA